MKGSITSINSLNSFLCVNVVPQNFKDSLSIRNVDISITVPCSQSCKTCDKWNRCSTCPENSRTTPKGGDCYCNMGFIQVGSHPLQCAVNPFKILNCKDLPFYPRVTELTESVLKTPEKINHWRINKDDLKPTHISKCGNFHFVGGKGVVQNNDIIQKTFKQLPPHFKVIISARVVVVDGFIVGDKSNTVFILMEEHSN